MAIVKVRYLSHQVTVKMYTSNSIAVIAEALENGQFTESELFVVNGDSMDAAEEAFDLTNNPYRQDEREEKYGTGRSISVGDVVVVGDEEWVCLPMGWKEVKVTA